MGVVTQWRWASCILSYGILKVVEPLTLSRSEA